LTGIHRVGYLAVVTAMRQVDERAALAQGLVVKPAGFGLVADDATDAVPELAGM